MLSSASDILQTTPAQRSRHGTVRGHAETQPGQDFAALVDSNASADKAAQNASAGSSESQLAEKRAARADRSSQSQAENAEHRREQAQQTRAARNRDDRNQDATARRDAAETQTEDRITGTRARQSAAQDAGKDPAGGTDQNADSETELNADQPSRDTICAIAVALNPGAAPGNPVENSGGDAGDGTLADALNATGNANNAAKQAAFAQLASEAAAQDSALQADPAGADKDHAAAQTAAIATDAAANLDALNDIKAGKITSAMDASSVETTANQADAASEAAANARSDTARAAQASANQDGAEQVMIDTAARHEAKAQSELQAGAANRTANNDDAASAGEQSAVSGKADKTNAALAVNADAASGARALRNHQNGEINRAPQRDAASNVTDSASRDSETALTGDSAATTKAGDTKDAATVAHAEKAGVPHPAAERAAAAANHALALQAALADSSAAQAQSSFANPASAQTLPGGLHQPILQNVALFDAQATGQTGNQASGQMVAVSGLATEIVARSRDGSNRFEIRLDPAELGRIDVRLDVDKHGNVSSRLIVERTETLDMLRRDAAGLERALQDAGLKTSDNGLQFSLRDQNAGRQQDDQSQNQRHARLIIADDDLTAKPAGQTYGRMLGNAGGLDIRV